MGILAGVVCCCFFRLSLMWAVLLMVPMVVDGFVQLATSYESTNPRRFVTGLLFGYGLWMLFVITSIMAFEFGYHLVRK